MRRKSKRSIQALIGLIDFPHTRNKAWDGSKRTSELSWEKLICYGNKLRALGMPDHEIACLLGDLYWASFEDCKANGTFQTL